MAITKSSLFLRLLLALWHAGTYSAPARFCRWLEGGVRRAFSGSALWRFAWREGAVSRYWPDSIACRLFTGIVNIPCALLKWIYLIGQRWWEGSLTNVLVQPSPSPKYFSSAVVLGEALQDCHAPPPPPRRCAAAGWSLPQPLPLSLLDQGVGYVTGLYVC